MKQLTIGTVISLDGQPFEVVWSDFMRTAQRKPVMRTKLRNLITANVLEQTFKPDDRIEEANLDLRKATYLYTDGEGIHFMDAETFDQFFFPAGTLGNKAKFLKENGEVEVLNFNDKPVTVRLSKKIAYRVVEAPPGVRGDTSTNVFKTVTLENGLELKAPLFINEGDEIRVNTETGEYVERV